MKTTKRIFAIIISLALILTMVPAFALAEATPTIPEGASFEFVDADAIGVENSGVYVYIASELYDPEPMLMPIILVYADKAYEDADAAWKVMCDNGLLDIAEAEHAAVMLINPVGDTWSEKDHDVFKSIVTKVCAAKNGSTIFGFYTYCTMISAIGEGSGATFINEYLTQDCNRLAAVATFGGEMSADVEPYTALPAYISRGSSNAIEYYKAANEIDTRTIKDNGLIEYNKADFPTQRVVVDPDGPSSFDKDAIADAWYYVIRRTTRNAIGDPLWQYPNTYDILTLMPRPMINELDLTMVEQGNRDENGKIIKSTRWYEWIPNEVYDTMADPDDDTTYPLVMCYHGSGDHPIFEAESNGWVQMAGEERFILVSPETNNNAANNIALIKKIIDTYPIDESRIYVTGFSMGAGNTNTTISAYPDFFAAAAPSAMNSAISVSEETIANIDLPIYETACSNDLYLTKNGRNYSFKGLNAKLQLNNIDIQLSNSDPDYDEYPFYGFDINEVTETGTVYSAHGVPFNVSTFRDEDGVPLVKFRVAMGMNHNHYTEFARDIWNYFKCFSRDPETKAVIYTDPESTAAIPDGASFAYVDADAIGVEDSGIYVYIASELYNPEPMLMPIILVYADKAYEDADAAWKVMYDNGLLDIAEAEHAAVMLINPVGDTWSEKDLAVYKSIVTKVCAAKNGSTIFGFYTYCTMISAIGEGSGATFINEYLTQDCNRLAAVATFGGEMSANVEPYTALPAYISSGSNNAIAYYKAANETDSKATKDNGLTEYTKAAFPTQRVVVDPDGPSSFDKDAIADAWNYVIRRTTRNAIGDPLWQYPNTYDILTLMPRPMINELDLTMNEKGDIGSDGKIIKSTRWYEWIPNEVYDTMANPADDTTYALVMCYHGSGDHPIFEAESNGWVQMAGEERFILVAPETNNNTANNMALIQKIMNTYPVDESRIYVTGFSMGCGNTNSTAVAYTDFFAAIAPSANPSGGNIAYSEETIANVDLPIYETACSKDLYATRNNGYRSFAALNAELRLNNIDVKIGSENPDYEAYPFYGFDIFEAADTETVYSVHGVPFNVSTFRNEDGVPLVKFRVAMDMNHNHYTEFARDIWNYFKCFSRDPETKEVIYEPGYIVIEDAMADADSNEAEVAVYYKGDGDVQGITMEINSELPIKAVKADGFSYVNGNKVVVASGKAMDKSEPLFTVIFDTSNAIGEYAVSGTIIEFVNGNDKLAAVSSVLSGTVTAAQMGDVDMDGQITTVDLVKIARYIIDAEELTPVQIKLADIDGDGVITTADLVKLARMIVAE